MQTRGFKSHVRTVPMLVSAMGLAALLICPLRSNAQVLMNKRYDQQTYISTHNSFANPAYHYGIDFGAAHDQLRNEIDGGIKNTINHILGDVSYIPGVDNAIQAVVDFIGDTISNDLFAVASKTLNSSSFAPLADQELSIPQQLDQGTRSLQLEVFRMRQLPPNRFYQVQPDINGFFKNLYLVWPNASKKIADIAWNLIQGNTPPTSDWPTVHYDLKRLTTQWDLYNRTQVDYNDPNSQYCLGSFDTPDPNLVHEPVDLYVAHDPARWGYMLTNLVFGQYPFVSLKQCLLDIKGWMNEPRNSNAVVSLTLKVYVRNNYDIGPMLKQTLQDVGMENMVFYVDQEPANGVGATTLHISPTWNAAFTVPNLAFPGNSGMRGPDGMPWANWKDGWPTIQQMVDSGKRLVLTTNVPATGFAYDGWMDPDSPAGGDCYDPIKAVTDANGKPYRFGDLNYAGYPFNWYPAFSTTGPGYLAGSGISYDPSLGIVDFHVMNGAKYMATMLFDNVVPLAGRYPNTVQVKFADIGIADLPYSPPVAAPSGPMQLWTYLNQQWDQLYNVNTIASLTASPNPNGWFNGKKRVALDIKTFSTLHGTTISAPNTKIYVHEFDSTSTDFTNVLEYNSDYAEVPILWAHEGRHFISYVAVSDYINQPTVNGKLSYPAYNSSGSKTALVQVDTTPPVTKAALNPQPNGDGWNNTPVTVTLSATDNLSGVLRTTYGVNIRAGHTYTQPVTISATGIYTFNYCSQDLAENREPQRSLALRIDTQAPTTTAVVEGGNGHPATVTLSATDNLSGVKYVNFEIDGAAIKQARSFPVEFTVKQAGKHTITYWSVDHAGNQESPHILHVTI